MITKDKACAKDYLVADYPYVKGVNPDIQNQVL